MLHDVFVPWVPRAFLLKRKKRKKTKHTLKNPVCFATK